MLIFKIHTGKVPPYLSEFLQQAFSGYGGGGGGEGGKTKYVLLCPCINMHKMSLLSLASQSKTHFPHHKNLSSLSSFR